MLNAFCSCGVRGAALAHQREHGGGVAKLRAVIGALGEQAPAASGHLCAHERGQRREGQRRPFLVAEHGEPRRELRRAIGVENASIFVSA